jgi:hypothetical protein
VSDDSVVVPFVLPGPASDRETATGWTRWRTTRHAFVSAPRLTTGEYGALSPRKRTLYDLHRAASHANLAFQETPMGSAVSRVMWSRLQNNALKHHPTTRAGLMISGGGYQGKTETACEVAAAFEDQWLDLHHQVNPHAMPGTRDLWATVAYVQTPVTATPKSVCEAILDSTAPRTPSGPSPNSWPRCVPRSTNTARRCSSSTTSAGCRCTAKPTATPWTCCAA